MPSLRQQERSRQRRRERSAFDRLDLEVLLLDDEAREKRVALNCLSAFVPPPHPNLSKIPIWTLSRDHSMAENVDKDKSLLYVDNPFNLGRMTEHLKSQTQFAIDLEFGDTRSYLDVTALIQISTTTKNFIVDSLKLYNYIFDSLYEVMIDENILKIVFGTEDVMALQRDFSIRAYNIIDFQNFYGQANGLLQSPGLCDIVEKYFETELNKKYQHFNWRFRPLPSEALNYAQKDSELLLDCWEHFKIKHANMFELDSFDFTHHRDLMLRNYKFPPVERSFNRCFDFAWKQCPNHFKENFTLCTDKKIFKDLFTWRENTAKLRDEKPIYILHRTVNHNRRVEITPAEHQEDNWELEPPQKGSCLIHRR
ncbi:unnamed protein product [Orchesella dallaii]|uniref:3'-5' exonuclease domain-containing protein n=1 Tax=Orchesella dallaii TaxID=48710 RepID=A0ABP1QN18_9HEXA